LVARIEKVISGEEPVWKYFVDILGHTGLGAAYALPTSLAGVYLGCSPALILIVGCIMALLGGVAREVAQYMATGKPHPLDRALDALHHLLGAPVAWGIAVGIRALF